MGIIMFSSDVIKVSIVTFNKIATTLNMGSNSYMIYIAS